MRDDCLHTGVPCRCTVDACRWPTVTCRVWRASLPVERAVGASCATRVLPACPLPREPIYCRPPGCGRCTPCRPPRLRPLSPPWRASGCLRSHDPAHPARAGVQALLPPTPPAPAGRPNMAPSLLPPVRRCSTRRHCPVCDRRTHPLPLSVRHRPHAGPERVADAALAQLAAALLMAFELGGRKTAAQLARQVRQAAVAHPQWWHAPHARRRARSARVSYLPCIPASSARIRRRRPPPSTPRRRTRSGLRGLRPFVGGTSDLLLVAVRRPRALDLHRAHLGRIPTSASNHPWWISRNRVDECIARAGRGHGMHGGGGGGLDPVWLDMRCPIPPSGDAVEANRGADWAAIAPSRLPAACPVSVVYARGWPTAGLDPAPLESAGPMAALQPASGMSRAHISEITAPMSAMRCSNREIIVAPSRSRAWP